MSVEAWPFVLSRNPVLDWRAVSAPAFMVDRLADFELLQVAHPAPLTPHPWPLTVRYHTSSSVGPLTVVFASSMASHPDGTDRTDRFGRPVRLVYGIVLRGTWPVVPPGWGDAVAALEGPALDSLDRFWPIEDEAHVPAASVPIRLASPSMVPDEVADA